METVQVMRTLGHCASLRKWLENGAGIPKRGRNATVRDWTTQPGDASNFSARIRAWLLETPEGRDRVSKCEVDPSGFELDHAIAQALGGPNCIENIHIMPATHNRAFGDIPWFNAEKKRYMGAHQFEFCQKLKAKMQEDFVYHTRL